MKSLDSQLLRLQRRLGKREELIAIVVLAALAIGGFTFTVTTHYGTPAGAAIEFMAAVDRGDVDYAWTHSIHQAAGAGALQLTDRKALAAQVSAFQHSRSNFSVQSVGYTTGYSNVTLAYDTASGVRSTSLLLQGGAPHIWTVLLKPVALDIRVPPGAGTLTIDGQSVEATSSADLRVSVLPGPHKIRLAASRLYVDFTTQVDTDAPSAMVSFKGLNLTDQGTSDVRAVVAAAFQICARSTQLYPSACPQSLGETDLAKGSVTWSVLGDPMAAATVGIDDKSMLVVTGHFLMSLSYDSSYYRRQRLLGIGGPYVAVLGWDGKQLTLSGFQDATAVPGLPPPAASDADVLGALKAQFDSCLKLQDGEAPRCPQSVLAIYGSNFRWHDESDPLQGARPVWDGKRAMFTVAGNFSFSVDYVSTPPIGPSRQIHDTTSGSYVADLYWDGSRVVFIGFEK